MSNRSLAAILRARLDGTASALNDPRVRHWALRIAIVFLLAGLVVSVQSHADLLLNLHLGPLAVLLAAAVPATLIMNALEFQMSGGMVHTRVSFRRSLEITILGTAANLLPLPGSVLVRIAGLKAAGAGYGASTAGTLLVAVQWLGISFLCAGAGVLVLGSQIVAGAFLTVGVAATAGGFVCCWALNYNMRMAMRLSAIKFALVSLNVCQTILCFGALGVSVSVWHGAVFSVSGPIGSTVSIVPAGIGVREGVSAAIGPLIGLSASIAFLATALNRLAGLAVLLPVALMISRVSKRQIPAYSEHS